MSNWQEVAEDSGYTRYVRNIGSFVLEAWSHEGANGDIGWYWRVSGDSLTFPEVGLEDNRYRAMKEAERFAEKRDGKLYGNPNAGTE